ncbi:MAG: hypothetical protein JW983_07910 [Elusimicrobia bacterium]|nr:hypothetical protein [Elusimicrobiota bacterium]
MKQTHKRIIIGTEIETYSIIPSDNYNISYRVSKPPLGVSEKGERFIQDKTIGSEYNSKPFETIREAFFLLKSGLRKYFRRLYRSRQTDDKRPVPLLVGTWINRLAGVHIHISIAEKTLTPKIATSLSNHIHDHIPLLIAVAANSPVWNRKITAAASNRILHGTKNYFSVTKRNKIETDSNYEITYNPRNRIKPPTLELRIFDSNIPEFIVTSICLVKAICLKWLRHRPKVNYIKHNGYIQARNNAAIHGTKCKLLWKKDWVSFRDYFDRFLWEHREELEIMDIPEDIYKTLQFIKSGYNGTKIIHDSAVLSKKKYPRAWEKYFAKHYNTALEQLLNGNSLRDFAAELGIKLPETENAWLGRKNSSIGR